jgi:hypothetical protein
VSREEHEKEVRGWEEGSCRQCGNSFPQRHSYERSCPACFKIERDYKMLWGDLAFVWMQEQLKEAQLQLRDTQRALKAAKKVQVQPPVKPPPRFKDDLLRQVISLCHPDKHGGSERATKVTQELLSMRSTNHQKKRKS